MAKKNKPADKLAEAIRLLVWEKNRNHPDYALDANIQERVAADNITDVAEVLDLFFEFGSKWKHDPIDPNTPWDEIKDKAPSLFLCCLPDLQGYSAIKKACEPLAGKKFVGSFTLGAQFPADWTGEKQRFLPKQWQSWYEAWELVEHKNYSMEDVALTLRRPLSTTYRLYNEAGRHIIGDSFKGKKRDRVTDWSLYDEHELNYMRLVEWIQAERIFPRAEQIRLQLEYLSVNHVTVVKSPRRKKKRMAVKLEPLEYKGTTGSYTQIMGNWGKHLESLLDLEKIQFIRGRLKECGKIPQDCRALCLLCQVQGELHFLETDDFRKTLEALGINALWKERRKRSLVENTLYRGKFFYDREW